MHLCATTVKQLKWWHMILELVCDVLPCKVMFIIQMVCCLGAVTSLQMMECYEKSAHVIKIKMKQRKFELEGPEQSHFLLR